MIFYLGLGFIRIHNLFLPGNDGPLDAAAFENEWVEVEAKQPHPPPEFPLFLHDNISRTCQFDTTSKRGGLSIEE